MWVSRVPKNQYHVGKIFWKKLEGHVGFLRSLKMWWNDHFFYIVWKEGQLKPKFFITANIEIPWFFVISDLAKVIKKNSLFGWGNFCPLTNSKAFRNDWNFFMKISRVFKKHLFWYAILEGEIFGRFFSVSSRLSFSYSVWNQNRVHKCPIERAKNQSIFLFSFSCPSLKYFKMMIRNGQMKDQY